MKRKFRDEQKGAFFLGAILVLVLTVTLIFTFALRTDTVSDILENDQVIRVLYVFEDDDCGLLFSSVLIYYPESKRGAIVNIPNKTGAIYNSLGRVDQIQAVYMEKGIQAFKEEVENLLEIPIPFYTVVKASDLYEFIDMVGGFRIFIPSPVDNTDENGKRWLLPSGAVTLDGEKIETYLHYNDETSNDDEYEIRCQNVMAAYLTSLHDKAYSILNNKNFKRYTKHFTSAMDNDDKYRLFTFLSEIDSESVIKQTITGSYTTMDGKTLLMPQNNGDFIKDAVKQTTGMLITTGGNMTSRIYVLQIQNGTRNQGLAGRTATLFKNAATYDVLDATNADRDDYEETVIVDHIGNPEVAQMVGSFINCSNIKEEEIKPEEEGDYTAADVDFTIILGKDFNGRRVVSSR